MGRAEISKPRRADGTCNHLWRTDVGPGHRDWFRCQRPGCDYKYTPGDVLPDSQPKTAEKHCPLCGRAEEKGNTP